jgi:23S rRNA pseudouridine2605 synthase
VRLNQFLARAAGGSRREADGWIRDGRVQVNGQTPPGMGIPVEPDRDVVTLDGKPVRLPQAHRYLAYHKPRGLLVSRRSQGGLRTIFESLGERARGLHAVGRLDLDSEGLLLLTDDGDLSEALLHPRSAVLRRYRVWVTPVPDPAAMRRFASGGIVEGVQVAPLRVVLEGAERGHGILLIDLSEGKKREVRALAAGAGLDVDRLLRIQFGAIRLGPLPPGAIRPLSESEVVALSRDAFHGPASGATLR